MKPSKELFKLKIKDAFDSARSMDPDRAADRIADAIYEALHEYNTQLVVRVNAGGVKGFVIDPQTGSPLPIEQGNAQGYIDLE